MVLTMMCDLIVAAENTKFSYPEARLGFTGGMIAGLAARIPHKAAMDLILLGRAMDARRAHGIGLVSDVVPTGKQLEVAMEQAQTLAASAPLVLTTIKRFVNQHVDIKEGVAAFREKRAPVYTGR